MIIIKGNLIIDNDKLRIESLLRQAQNRVSSETSSELITDNIVAFVDLKDYDTTNATVFTGDLTVNDISNTELILVTGEVTEVGGTYEPS